MRSKTKEKQEAIRLRQKGWSYTQIMNKLKLTSKGTLSYWFRDLKLSPQSKQRLRKNLREAHQRGLHRANKRKQQQAEKDKQEAYKLGKSQVNQAQNKNTALLYTGIALYWGEGTKYASSKNSCLELANADEKMIKTFLKFLSEILNVPKEKIKMRVQIYPQTNTESAITHWQKVTGIQRSSIYTTKAVSRASKRKRSSNKLRYGTAAVRVSDRKLFHQMRGMIDGLAEKYVQ